MTSSKWAYETRKREGRPGLMKRIKQLIVRMDTENPSWDYCRIQGEPNCNAFAERFVLSIKSECLNRMIFFGEDSLRSACFSFVDHYHVERAHQSLDNERINRTKPSRTGDIKCTKRLGGILKSNRPST